MAIDASIPLRAKAANFAVPDYDAEQSKALQLKSLLMQQQQQERQIADENAQRKAFQQSNGDLEQFKRLLAGQGNYKAYGATQKQQAENAKLTAEGDKLKGDVINQGIARHRDMLAGVNDPQTAAEWVKAGYADPVTGGVLGKLMPVEEAIKRIPTDPVLFQQWKQQAALGATKYIEQNKPHYQSAGDRIVSIPGLGGEAKTVTTIGQSPDSKASTGLGYAKLAEDTRHHGAVEGKGGAGGGKPLPASAVKLQNEELQAIGTFAGIDADLAGIEKQLTDGKLKLGLTSNALNSARNYTGNSNEESKNLASFKSKMENLRNATLLLNKGVQTEGDAQRAMNELMSNLNDEGVVKQRLAEIRALNRRAVELRKNNIGVLRSNYGKDELDFSNYENQPSTTNLGSNKPSKTKSGASVSNW